MVPNNKKDKRKLKNENNKKLNFQIWNQVIKLRFWEEEKE